MVEWGERDGSGAAERCVGGAVFEGQGVLFVLCGARDGDGDGKGARFERFAISIDSFFVLICFSLSGHVFSLSICLSELKLVCA